MAMTADEPDAGVKEEISFAILPGPDWLRR